MKKKIKKNEIHQTKLVLPNQPYHEVFLETMSRIFCLSRWFGVMGPGPLIWKAWSVSLFVCLVVIEFGAIWKVIKALAGWAADTAGNRSVTARLSGTIFYTSAIASLLLSSKLFFQWEYITTIWVSIERSMLINIAQDLTLKKGMVKAVIIMVTCSVLEHLTSAVSLVGLDCPPRLILKKYTLNSHGFLFLNHDYSVWIAFPLLFLSNIATVLWNFQDILIVLISMGLTSRYRRLNQYVAKVCAAQNKSVSLNLKAEAVKVYAWRKIREAYVKQAALVRMVDGYIGGMVLLSSFGNFYFICLQLFLGITQGIYGTTVIKMVYYMVSLVWLIVRFTWMVLAAADINVQSKQALSYLHSFNSNSYNVEIERLQNQLRKDYVSLSGMGFYPLNRNILLKVAASVLTYELVLIQFDNKDSTDH